MAEEPADGGGGAGRKAEASCRTRRWSQRPVATWVATPQFSAENFRTYMEEVDLWRSLGEVPEEKQGIMLWLALPRDYPSDIKELILVKVSEELKKNTGVTKFVEAMNEAFKPTNESRELEMYTEN